MWSFENAMFPETRHGLSSYEYFIAPTTKTVVLHSVSGESMRTLRLSGFLRLDQPLESCKMLQHLTIHGVTGNYFDQRPLTEMEDISLQSFQYHQGSALGFEIQTQFLSSVILGSHSSLKKLVLLQCSRLSTTGLVSCLSSLTSLEYFSISLITHNELDGDFIAALAPSTHTIKLKILEARFTRPFITEEKILCESLKCWLPGQAKPKLLRLHLPHVIYQSSRKKEWMRVALENGVDLKFGDWEASELI